MSCATHLFFGKTKKSAWQSLQPRPFHGKKNQPQTIIFSSSFQAIFFQWSSETKIHQFWVTNVMGKTHTLNFPPSERHTLAPMSSLSHVAGCDPMLR